MKKSPRLAKEHTYNSSTVHHLEPESLYKAKALEFPKLIGFVEKGFSMRFLFKSLRGDVIFF